MKVFSYKDREKNNQDNCEVCYKYKGREFLAPHHIDHRANSERCIWVCFDCHRNLHDHPKIAYEKGYLVHHKNASISKKQKRKVCLKHIPLYNSAEGCYLCQFCKIKLL